MQYSVRLTREVAQCGVQQEHVRVKIFRYLGVNHVAVCPREAVDA